MTFLPHYKSIEPKAINAIRSVLKSDVRHREALELEPLLQLGTHLYSVKHVHAC